MNVETVNIEIPNKSTMMVVLEHPFHSLRMIPQRFEKMTFRAIKMQNAKVVSAGESTKNPLPRLRPKN